MNFNAMTPASGWELSTNGVGSDGKSWVFPGWLEVVGGFLGCNSNNCCLYILVSHSFRREVARGLEGIAAMGRFLIIAVCETQNHNGRYSMLHQSTCWLDCRIKCRLSFLIPYPTPSHIHFALSSHGWKSKRFKHLVYQTSFLRWIPATPHHLTIPSLHSMYIYFHMTFFQMARVHLL